MDILTNLLITDNKTIYVICVIVLLLVCVYIGFLIYKSIKKHRFKKSVENLIPHILQTTQDFTVMFNPAHRVDDEEIDEFKRKHVSLEQEIDALKSNKYYSESLCEELGLFNYKKLLADCDKLKKENNTAYDAIEDLKGKSAAWMEIYNACLDVNHYFACSEKEFLIEHYNMLEEKKSIVFPKYAKYVTDYNTNLLPQVVKDIENERIVHNKAFVFTELDHCKEYFDHVLGKYPLDPQQRDSIVKLEDNCLVIASAGSGKTSTIVGKAKYLVEKRHINPAKILLLTYTKKAANELAERMNIEGINSGTFHSLAYRIIAETTGMAPSICRADVPLNVFRDLILHSPTFLSSINSYILNYQSQMKLEHEYEDAFTYFEDRKKYGIQALFPDMDGNIIFTRSEEEKRLCTILTRFGVNFKYEYNYEFNTRTNENRQYKPDFSIFFTDEQGREKRIYLEHFAINSNGLVPQWFGEGTRGGWKAAQDRYREGMEWKHYIHKIKKTKLIETKSADFWDGTVEEKLKEQLVKNGVPIKERTDEELYNMLIQRNRQLEKTVFTLLLSFITLMKANEKTIDGLLEVNKDKDGKMSSIVDVRNRFLLEEVVKPFFDAYQEELEKNLEIDFTDAIIQATKICREGLWKEYDYILVDEFQDISVDRYKLLQALRSETPKTKLYCVGDDWQSIFRFAGSDMDLFYEFEKYFGYTEICKIETTYRFHQPLIDQSSAFIMKNPAQKEKTIKTPEGDSKQTSLNFVKCGDGEEDNMLAKVTKIVSKIPKDETILIIGRYNYDAVSLGFNGKVSDNDFRIRIKLADREMLFMSVHSSKGLEADHVILINCNQGSHGFPSLIEDDPILDFVLSKSEHFPFAEERRLFYVAMTRAKKHMYVLYDKDRPSPFIGEFLLKLDIGSYLCPKCLEGRVTSFSNGVTSNGQKYRSYKCSNNYAGCDFFETRYGDLTPPGILITENMTAQDVEAMRENRRRSKNLIQSTITNKEFKIPK